MEKSGSDQMCHLKHPEFLSSAVTVNGSAKCAGVAGPEADSDHPACQDQCEWHQGEIFIDTSRLKTCTLGRGRSGHEEATV